MYKTVNYKGKEYRIEFSWSGSSYCVRAMGISGFISIPTQTLSDINKIKPYIIEAIEYKPDLIEVIEWDGNLD
jgi:hypothetical protein